MKQIITEKEVDGLTGKFIIEIDSDDPGRTITNENWNFQKEKRIYFVCGLAWVGFYYEHRKFKTKAEFVQYFNHYLEDGTNNDKRFHRLLTSKEIDFVTNKMKENNY